MQGYFNKKITVDLTRGKIEVRPIPDEMVRTFVGGSGLAARMLYDHIDETGSWDSPQSRLYFSTGPFTGTAIPSSG
ncbi:MAG: aldehyde ferredoxin oxidoreductase N-terminal domain-containing protein, partial [Desulfotignum sp.]|nr:aldehyde ferredoxin oxidoreductase [Desulfobacteraceae bacterium]